MISLLAITFAGNADAQFWKKKSKRKHRQEQAATAAGSTDTVKHELTRKERKKIEKAARRKEKKERKHKQSSVVKKATRPAVPLVKTREEIVYPPTRFKPRYRIDVLADLYLDELVKGKYVTYNNQVPERAAAGVSFIQGVQLAADSMKKAGYNVDIYVHDVTSFQESAPMLTMHGQLDSTDLIIGAVNPQDIAVLAAFAKKKQIYFISVLATADGGVRDNPFFTILQPSLKSHCEAIVKNINEKYVGQRVTVLYRNNSAQESSAYSYITADSGKLFYSSLLCNKLPSHTALAEAFGTAKNHVLVMPVLDVVYADSLLKVLSRDFPETHFEIYGMPAWSDLHKTKGLANLDINYTVPFNYNVASTSGAYIERNFKKDYSGKPSELVYRGYESLLWYSSLLKGYGTIFKYTDNAPAPFTPFHVLPQWDKNNDLLYNQNQHVFLVKFK